MAQPPPYSRLRSFVQYQLDVSDAPYNPAHHDAEFDAVEDTLDATLANLALIQRDDGAIKNAAVHPDSLSVSTKALIAADWSPRGLWATAIGYVVGDVVQQGTTSYVAAELHTSGVFATDYAAGKWVILGETAATVSTAVLASLADTTVTTNGDALVGMKYEAPSAVALNLHKYIEDDGYNLSGFLSAAQRADVAATNATLDCSAAINLAMAALQSELKSGVLRAMGPRYLIDSLPITLLPGITLQGSGSGDAGLSRPGTAFEGGPSLVGPIINNDWASGFLHHAGLFDLRVVDGLSDGIHLTHVGENTLIDRVAAYRCGANGIKIGTTGSGAGGTPVMIGRVSTHENVLAGLGYYGSNNSHNQVLYIAGDNNLQALVYVDQSSDTGTFDVMGFKSERWGAAPGNPSVFLLNDMNGGVFRIGGGRTVTGAGIVQTTGSIIRQTGTPGRVVVSSGIANTTSSTDYVYGYEDATNARVISIADFVNRPLFIRCTPTVFDTIMDFVNKSGGILARWMRSGDANNRFQIRDTGQLDWGDGTLALDTTLTRGAANCLQLATGDKFRPADAAGQTLGDSTHTWRLYNDIILTANLPVAAASMNGVILIEDAGVGNRNIILYAGGERFRIDGGANV